MSNTTFSHRFLWNVHANSSSSYATTSDLLNMEEPRSSLNSPEAVFAAGPALISRELTAQIKHVKPLLQAPSKHSHPPLIQGSVSRETAVATHSALSGLSPQKEKRLRELYKRLDMDNDGTVDIRDLTAALKHEMPHIPARLAPKLMARLNPRNEDKVDFGEFVNYVLEHEKRLEAIFQDLDKNNDGTVDVREIKAFCKEQGIPLDDNKARSIVERMDRSGSSSVDLSEFQQFMLLYPSSDVKDMVDFWRHNLVIDIGEDSQVPEDFTDQEIISGVWWRHLVAGGIAGCMSRTCTAPFDRLKVFMQVHSSRSNKLGVLSSLRLLHAEGGVKSFWRGNGINVIKIAPESAIKFMAYEQCKRLIQKYKKEGELTVMERFFAGSAGKFFCSEFSAFR
ncbi:calcium-binding mitochondrial carrier protein SCaMC-3 [Trichostrongylus colubriformis]|uniref:Calcium-binding mitochondrial carrier protein SCaMC-3 n=1 Tax=Trichostrongylus colubriformis TaxID=6319 RepID=A0AAN8IMD9_TRICO